MVYVVLATWIVQGAVGAVLFARWLRRRPRHGGAVVLTHVALALTGLACWVWFTAGGGIAPAWIAFGVLTVGNGFGDALLLRRNRARTGVTTTFWRDYGAAIASVFRGELPPRVAFHALFAGVVYFTCLGVCIGASIAAA